MNNWILPILSLCGLACTVVGAWLLVQVGWAVAQRLGYRAARWRDRRLGHRSAIARGFNTGAPPLGVPLLVLHDGVRGGMDVMEAMEVEYDDGRQEVFLSGRASNWSRKTDQIDGWLEIAKVAKP